MTIDVSVVLNAHRRDTFLKRTLLSLGEAASFASGLGVSSELVVVLDRSDSLTKSVVASFKPPGFSSQTVFEVDNGSLGLSRNDGADASRGTCVFMHDADDLISYNAIYELYMNAVRNGVNSIQICGILMAFGADYHVVDYFGSDVISPMSLVDGHPYVSRIFAHRALFKKLRYTDLRLTAGYAFEDWFFNAEALAAGCTFHSVKDAIFFYRRRTDGLLEKVNLISTRQIPPSKLFEPDTFLRLGAEGYERVKENAQKNKCRISNAGHLEDPVIFDFVAAANSIEPQIDFGRLSRAPRYTNMDFYNPAVGVAYYEASRIVGSHKFSDVFLLPFFDAGGAERYFLDILTVLKKWDCDGRVLVLLGQRGPKSSWLDRFSSNVVVVDFPNCWPDLTESGRDIITLKLLHSCAPNARLHLKPCEYVDQFSKKFLKLLTGNKRIYYRFSDAHEFVRGRDFVSPYGFEFMSDLCEDIDLLVSDNQTAIEFDTQRIGALQEKWKLLHSRQAVRITPEQATKQSLQSSPRPRIAWASRLDSQKRPELIFKIAAQLQIVRPDVELHIFGKAVLGGFDYSLFKGF